MKQSAIQVGKKYMLSLGRAGARAVTVTQKTDLPGDIHWRAVDSSGREHVAGARRLSPCPVTDRDGKLLGYAHELDIG